MRDLILFGLFFSLLPFVFKRPVIGVYLFTWVSLMNPHRLTYGAAYAFPFAAIAAGATILSVILSKQPKRLPVTPLTAVLFLFIGWMTFTSFFALEPDLVWGEWNRVMKTMLMVMVAIIALNTRRDIYGFAIVIALSLGFYGFKGGIFTIASGGSSHVLGPVGTYIGDNNCLALALVTSLPLIWYLRMSVDHKWLKRGLSMLVFLTAMAIVGSYSRGALLAGGAMFFFLWLKSRNKLQTMLGILLLAPLFYFFIPQKWLGRMETIDDYQQDASAMGRINAWNFAMNVAREHFLGGGYIVFTPKMFMRYAPVPQDYHVAHSIYFQVLGEHGYVGLVLYLLLMLMAWRSGSRIIKFCKGKEEFKWASDLAGMCQVSIVGYAAGGAFLSLAYYDLYYCIIALLVALEKVVLRNNDTSNVKTVPT